MTRKKQFGPAGKPNSGRPNGGPPADTQGKQFMVVSYDISDDRRRTKVMKQMENFGRRVQYSVFECELRPEQLRTLQGRLRPLLKEREDSVRFYYLPEEAVTRIETLAGPGVVRDPAVYIVTGVKEEGERR